MKTPKTWLRRLGCFAAVIIWLVVMLFPTFAFLLAARGQLQFGNDVDNHLRFFIVQEEESAGVGIEWTRPYQENCTQTSVNYVLWEGNNGQSTSYCQCFDQATGDPLPINEGSCQP